MRIIIMLAMILSWNSVAYAANPSIKIKWKYYDISGSTKRELLKQLKRKGPNGYWAYSKWSIQPGSACRVKLKLDYTMPRWKNRKGASKKLQKSWNKMIINLKRHEEGHGNFAIKAAKHLTSVKCKGAKEVYRNLKKQNKDYDRKTRHGIRQGVKF